MKSIVVTGATGMIGAALIGECLKHNIQVFAVVRKNSAKRGRLPKHPLLHTVDADLEQLSELPDKIPKGCDTFYHIAWENTGAHRDASVCLQSQNITYTLEAVKAASKLGCRRFIGAGSQAEYGPTKLLRISPDSPTNPCTPYGVSKLAAGKLAGLLCKELGMECIWPRIFSVYGIYEKETTMIASSLRKMLAKEPTDFTPAQQMWDYLYSKDAGRAYYLIGEKGRAGAVYCVGSGSARPLKEYILQMAEITGAKEVRIGSRPYPPNAPMQLCADTDSLYEDTGFVPKYDFERGIKETVSWLKQTGA